MLSSIHRDLHRTLGSGPTTCILAITPCIPGLVRLWTTFSETLPSIFHAPQLSNHCAGGHNSIYFQRKGSGSSFSFSSHTQSVISFCHPVLTFSLCFLSSSQAPHPKPLSKLKAYTGVTASAKLAPPGWTAERHTEGFGEPSSFDLNY